MCLQYKSFENTVGKGEIAPNMQFLLFWIQDETTESSAWFFNV